MAKGQTRSNREVRKPKQEKVKVSAAAASVPATFAKSGKPGQKGKK